MALQGIRAINLLRNALRRAKVPLFWHKHSPKKFTVHQHAVVLVFRRKMKASYVDFEEFWLPLLTPVCKALGLECAPDQSTMCREEHRLRFWLEETSVRLVQAALPLRPFA